jgi:hypothetical protein
VLLTLVAKGKNLQSEKILFSLFATGVVDTGGKFAAGIVDTSGKFATRINNTGL